MHVFDTKKFLETHFQSAAKLIAFLKAYDCPTIPSEEAVGKWFQRRSIPGEWFPLLVAYIEIENGAPVSLRGYLMRGSNV